MFTSEYIDFREEVYRAWSNPLNIDPTTGEKPVMKLECWDKEEADLIRRLIKQKHPEIKFFCTWLSEEGKSEES